MKTKGSRGEAASDRTIAPNVFIGKTLPPSDAELAEALGSTKTIWDELLASLASEHGVAIQQWKSYSPKAGWSLRLLRGKRTILWLTPCEGCFRVAVILGDKAVQAARQCGLSERGRQALEGATKYAEGTGVRLLIQSRNDLPTIKKLVCVKLEN